MYVAWHSRRFSSFCHFVPECKSTAPNLMYISLCLHVALRVCSPKSPSDSHQLHVVVTVAAAAAAAAAVVVVIVVLSLYSMYAYIYEWNIFAWRSDFPFNFATYTCMHTERAPFQLPHLYTWHRKFSGSFLAHIWQREKKIDPLQDNNKLKTKSDRKHYINLCVYIFFGAIQINC